MSNTNNDAVQDLINQLQMTTKQNKEMTKLDLNRDTLEHFLLHHSGLLISNSVKFVDDVKDYIGGTPTPEEMESLAKLITASSAAIESLNKIFISNERNKTAKDIKQMDIESKKELQDENNKTKLLLNREELMKQLLNNAEIIDVVEDN